MTTAKVEIWRDCGFTEGTLEVPSKTSSLSNPDYTFTNLQISRETLFSQFKVKKAYEDLYDCSYLRMTMDMNNGDDVVLYGWIDRTSCGSDTANNPMTIIDWHTDYWRTFLPKASFGAGVVTKRPSGGTTPPQTYSNMTQLVTGTDQDLTNVDGNQYVYWAYCNLTVGDSTKTVTTLCWPVNVNAPNFHYQIMYGTSQIGSAPSFNQTMEGSFDEGFGIDPDAIYGCWLSPVPPAQPTFTTSSLSTYVTMSPWNYYNGTTYKAFKPFTSDSVSIQNYYPERTRSISANTTDTSMFMVTDFDGEPIFQFPWGVNVTQCTYRTVNADTSMYLACRFSTSSSDTLDAGANSLTCNIPLKSIPMSSNAKSSYVYSGQQEYDRESMSIARDQALVSGITSSLTGTTNNVVMSSLGNSKTQTSFNMPNSTASTSSTLAKTGGLSMGAAGAITMGASLAGSAIDYFATGYFNDRTMDATMDYKSKQTSTLTLPGSGSDWILNGRRPKVVMTKWDDYSIAQRDNDIALYGLTVREPMTSCQSLINAGGPLRIQNLNVTGQMPVGAKQFFRDRFANGVRII